MKHGGTEHEARVVRLAKAAAEKPVAEREHYLREQCGENVALFFDVCRALSQAEEATGVVRVPEGFRAGTVVGGRFRIVRRIGMGGMGLVYEAIDETLDRRVALKCAKSGHQMSLPPEARTAREVSHYNVCKVYDLHKAEGEEGEVTFLSMEYIEGETLAERIKSKGPMQPPVAFGIARQLCAGLKQAHLQKVIHGDLKLGNVLLGKGDRAVLTDFGLARFAEADGSYVLSRHGGTLDYMAPEMVKGERATVASDIYAMGVLFHALLTGKTPKRVNEEGGQEREIAVLPRPWEAVIRRCLEPLPERRFESVAAMMEALEPPRTVLKWVGAAVLLLALGLGGWWMSSRQTGPLLRLAILPVEAEAGLKKRMTPVVVDVAERLSGSRKNLIVIAPSEAAQNQVDRYEKAKGLLGATHALETRLKEVGGQLSVEARLVAVETGEEVRGLRASYAAGDAATLAKALLGTVNLGLNLKPGKTQETVADAAYEAYASGLNTMRQDPRMVDAALENLEKARQQDPKSVLPVAAIASAYVQKFRNGDGQTWLEQAEKMAAKAAGMNPDALPVLLCTGLVDQFRGRYEQAIANFNRALLIDPGNPVVWRTLAEVYQAAGRQEEALATYRKAIEAEPGAYQPYYFFGNFYLARGQWKEAEEMYRKTVEIAPGLGSAQMNLGLALKQQGRYLESEKALLKAKALRLSARVLLNLGALFYEQERYVEALANFEESAKMGPVSAALHRNVGDALRQMGRAKEARAAYEQARDKSEEEVTTNPRGAGARARLALVSARLGDAARARFEVGQVLAMEGVTSTARADAVQALEVLGLREKALEAMGGAAKGLMEELGRQPDLKALRADERFLQRVGQR
jgi:eukaryotic-like serine/threonine-protein kinase